MADTEGIYQVTATRGQCVATAGPDTIDAVYCENLCTFAIAIPDDFTPNGDKRNEEYKIPYSCPVDTFSMTIMDRWGQAVHQSNDIDQGWDGTFRGQPQPQGAYLWFICVKETAA
jgi:gliding motility-associated-like protein